MCCENCTPTPVTSGRRITVELDEPARVIEATALDPSKTITFEPTGPSATIECPVFAGPIYDFRRE